MTNGEIFELLGKQGWNKARVLEFATECVPIDSLDTWWLVQFWYDKTEKNACQCLAIIKAEAIWGVEYLSIADGGEAGDEQYVLDLETKIRHILLCIPGDCWAEKISGWLT